MNNIKKFLVIAMVCGAVGLYAQAPKFGHINSAELLNEMPDIKSADAELQTYQSQLENQLKTMTEDYQKKVQDYYAKEALLADAVKQSKAQEISDLELRIQEFQMSAQQSMEQKKEELYNPILEKAENAIKAIAKEKGYSYVLDTSPGSGVLYAIDSEDMMGIVKGKLGL